MSFVVSITIHTFEHKKVSKRQMSILNIQNWHFLTLLQQWQLSNYVKSNSWLLQLSKWKLSKLTLFLLLTFDFWLAALIWLKVSILKVDLSHSDSCHKWHCFGIPINLWKMSILNLSFWHLQQVTLFELSNMLSRCVQLTFSYWHRVTQYCVFHWHLQHQYF